MRSHFIDKHAKFLWRKSHLKSKLIDVQVWNRREYQRFWTYL